MDSLDRAASGGDEHPSSPPGMELSDFASESVIVRDEHGVITYWNPASEALYGWPAKAMPPAAASTSTQMATTSTRARAAARPRR